MRGGVGDKGIRYKKEYLQKLPLVPANSKKNTYIQEISDYSNQLHTLYSQIKLQQENFQQLQNQLLFLENKINKIVYNLYHLTDEEIKFIERQTGEINNVK